MPAKSTPITISDDSKRRTFLPIHRDLLERLTRECETKSDVHWNDTAVAAKTAPQRKLRLR